ncbi:hypothetical protein [Pedobacter nototheniae]|uniref:hypothetical protein n=1 Tax=Pedobacter nototheniae TaxID=2488994 RepID=UPI00292F2F89|nr:hypothetical protein [Pedobacter nototheniae]
MKYILSLAIIIISTQAFAQQLSGQAMDLVTKLPVVNAMVIYGSQVSKTGNDGKFILTRLGTSQKITIKHIGYEPYDVNPLKKDSVLIYLTPISIDLSDITVNARKNYSKEISKLQQEYANMQVYQAPMFGNVLVQKGLRGKSEFAGLASNSTSSIASVDLLKVASLFKRKKPVPTNLKTAQEIAEDQKYIEEHFSEKTITSITGLQGDSLQNFIQKYRPSVSEIKQMNDYEILTYIKKSYTAFMKPN